MAEYFQGIGSRVEDIDLALKLAGDPDNPKVLEIGCGDGRDAKEIVKRTKNYVGFDISEEFIRIAKDSIPTASFEVGDAVTYHYPKNLDVVFAFASLLHLSKEEVKDVLKKVHHSLKPGGIFYISLKLRPEYTEEVKEDQFGKRMFFFYNPKIIAELAGSNYQVVSNNSGFITGKDTQWFEIALKKTKK